MDTHTNGKALVRTNGKHLVTHEPPKPDIERVFMLASEIISLEGRLNDTMKELITLVNKIDPADMPKLFIAMIKQPGISKSVLSGLPLTPVVVSPPPLPREPTLQDDLRERIIVVMDDGRERQANTIIKALRAKKQSASVYLALKRLVADGLLVKPAYGFYRKRGI